MQRLGFIAVADAVNLVVRHRAREGSAADGGIGRPLPGHRIGAGVVPGDVARHLIVEDRVISVT